MAELRKDLDDLLEKHCRLQADFNAYKESSNEQFTKLESQLEHEKGSKKAETTPVKNEVVATQSTSSTTPTKSLVVANSAPRDRLGMLKDSEIQTADHIKCVPREI